MTDYVIEKKHPVPGRNARGKWQDLAARMKPGHSVLVKQGHERSGLAAAIRKAGYQPATRTVENGFRVWRIK